MQSPPSEPQDNGPAAPRADDERQTEETALDDVMLGELDGLQDKEVAVSLDLDDTWLHDFYKECGREVTLAYTTLNQMKNWAIVVTTAIIAAGVSMSRSLNPSDITTASLKCFIHSETFRFVR